MRFQGSAKGLFAAVLLLVSSVVSATGSRYVKVATLAGGTADGKPVSAFERPLVVAVTSDGAVYVADAKHHQIRRLSPKSVVTVVAGSGRPGRADGTGMLAAFKDPAGVVWDAARDVLYVADTGNARICRVSPDGIVTTAASGGLLKDPVGVAVDAVGTLFVADPGADQILAISAAGTVTVVAGTGKPGRDDGAALAARFKKPSALAVSPDGVIFVADTGNDMIRRISAPDVRGARTVTTIAGSGKSGDRDGASLEAMFRAPEGLAIDATGDIVVSDSGNHRLRLIRLASPSVVETIAGGKNGFADGALVDARFQHPVGISLNGAVYVADSGNDAIRVIYPGLHAKDITPSQGPLAGGTVVRIAGDGFVPGLTTVRFGAAAATNLTFVGVLALDATVPASVTAGPVDVAITTLGESVYVGAFTYLAPPTIQTVTPPRGFAGDTVLIDGANFDPLPGGTTTLLGVTPLVISSVTPTRITATIPTGAATGLVTVATAGGTAISAAPFVVPVLPVVTSIAIIPASLTIDHRATGQLTATATYSDHSTRDVTATAAWTSANAAIASVTEGSVRGEWPGETTITASVDGRTATASVTVARAPESLSVAPTKLTLAHGSTGSLIATLRYSDGTIADTTATAQWASGNAAVATVDRGTVTGVAPGETSITAVIGSLQSSASVTVTAVARSFAVTPTSIIVDSGVTTQVHAFVTMSDGTTRDVTSAASWATSNAVIATVNGGVITAASPGSADVTATYDGITAAVAVTVRTLAPTVTSLSVSPSAVTLGVGASRQLAASAAYSDASTRDVTSEAMWTSGNPAVATVNSAGLVLTVDGGSATISASFGGFADTSHVDVTTVVLPPDPASVAPPIEQTYIGTTADGSRFLYTGANPIQTGVQPDAIDRARGAVLRGAVIDRSGAALNGVTVTIAGEPQYGSTLSRADGRFDMAVNGGGPLVVRYEKAGYNTAERSIAVEWGENALAPSVALIPFDTLATTIEFGGAGVSEARSSATTDSDGTRRATLVFQPSTIATMVLPDGTTRQMSSLTIRATEYSVGPNGPAAMPADLPTTSAYTYCVELSADEAVAAGATTVRFNRQVSLFVDNFLEFPVGAVVPSGYYDRAERAWKASDNGRVVGILTIENGLAYLDIDGDGHMDDASTIGITDADRAQLAEHYGAFQTAWWVPVRHFTPYDLNWGIQRSQGRRRPALRRPHRRGQEIPDESASCGSVINCETRVLGEDFAVPGTSFGLHYRSDRVSGRAAAYTLDIPLTEATVPNGVRKVHLAVLVGRQNIRQEFPPLPNQTATVTWDGYDAYDRRVQGETVAQVAIGYEYDAEYVNARDNAPAFGLSGNESTGVAARTAPIFYQVFQAKVGAWQAGSAVGLGGFTLTPHHTYDPTSRILYLGDGSRRSAEATGAIITTFAGTGVPDNTGDGGPAKFAATYKPHGIAVAPDNTVYLSDGYGNVRKVTPGGIITTIAGQGNDQGRTGDGGPAALATLRRPEGLALGPDGSLFIADAGNNVIRRIDPAGIISTYAGDGSVGYADGMASGVSFHNPTGLAVAGDGTVYVADQYNHALRRIGTDRTVTTVAGDGQSGYSGDGGAARDARLSFPTQCAVGADGNVYVLSVTPGYVRKIDTSGTITTIAGAGYEGVGKAGDPAVEYPLDYPMSIAVDREGALFVGEYNEGRVHQISADGFISPIAGIGDWGDADGDGGPATAGVIDDAWSLAVGPDGSLYVGSEQHHRVRKVTAPFPGVPVGTSYISSENGSEIYVFDGVPRHIRTVDAITGATKWAFGYDIGLLSTITDRAALETRIERGGLSGSTTIVAPFAQTTTLVPDGHGYVSSITNAAGEVHALTFDALGLLTDYVDPRHYLHHFTYDADGKLTVDSAPAGSSLTLTQTGEGNSFTVFRTTAMGRTSPVSFVRDTSATVTRSTTLPSGLTITRVTGRNAVQTATYPNGSQLEITKSGNERFGMQAPLVSAVLRLPSGLTRSYSESESVALDDPQEPTSVVSVTRTTTINGKEWPITILPRVRTFSAISPEGRVVSGRIDAVGRVLENTFGGLVPVLYSYDALGRVEAAAQGPRQYTFAYDSNGNLAEVTDPTNRRSTFLYDAVGRVTSQTLPGGRVVRFDYDENGNLTSVTPPGRPAHTFDFSAANQRELDVPPGVDGGDATRYIWNKDKQLTTVTRANGRTIEFDYDASGRLSTVTSEEGAYTQTYHPATGNVASVTAPGGNALSFSFDGSLPTAVTWSGDVNGTVGVRWDGDFRVTSQEVNGETATFTYDDDGLLMQAGTLELRRSPANGLILGSTLGEVTETRQYNELGDTRSREITFQGSMIATFEYERDDAGRIRQLREQIGANSVTTGFEYDDAGRLANVIRDGFAIASYSYDGNGNRVGGEYDAQDRLLAVGGVAYTYTANGELETRTDASGTTTYRYNDVGTLRGVALPDGTTIGYVLDAEQRRIGRKVNGSLHAGWLYADRGRIVAELDASGAVVTRFIYASRSGAPQYMIRAGTTYNIVTDHLGSPRLIVDVATGVVAQRMRYDEFGRVLEDTNPGFQPFGFAGGLYDAATGLVRFGMRDYDGRAGRWTSQDPLGFAGGDPNLYAYALTDPVNRLDPSGLISVGGAIGGLAELGSKYFGVGGQVSSGAGVFLPTLSEFVEGNWDRPSIGGFGSAGTLAYGGDESGGWPGCDGVIVGAYAGGGSSGWVSNADDVDDLSGPFHTLSFNAGWGTKGLSLQYSWGSNADGETIGMLSFGAGKGGGFGASVSLYDTYTQVFYDTNDIK